MSNRYATAPRGPRPRSGAWSEAASADDHRGARGARRCTDAHRPDPGRPHRTPPRDPGPAASGRGRRDPQRPGTRLPDGLGVHLRRRRAGGRGPTGGAVHPGQRLHGHARGRARVGGRHRPLPRHLRGRRLQPPDHRAGRQPHRPREPGQPAQLAPPELPGRPGQRGRGPPRPLVRLRPQHRPRAAPDPRHAPGHAAPTPPRPRRRRPDHLHRRAAHRLHGRPPHRRHRAGDHPRELVRPPRRPLRARRSGVQHQRGGGPPPRPRPPHPGRHRLERGRGGLARGRHVVVPHPDRHGRPDPHGGRRTGAGAVPHLGPPRAGDQDPLLRGGRGPAGHRREGRGRLHQPRPRGGPPARVGPRRPDRRGHLRHPPVHARAGLEAPVGAVRDRRGLRRRGRGGDGGGAAPRLPRAPDRVAPRQGHRRQPHRPRPARGGLPRPHLLGRAVRLPVPQLPLPRHHPRPPAVPGPTPPGRPPPGPGAGPAGGQVPLAVGQRRLRADAQPALEPSLGSLDARQLPTPAPRRAGRGVERLAVPPGLRRLPVHARARHRAAGRAGPLLDRPGHPRRERRPLPHPGRDGPRRVPRRLPRLHRPRGRRQRLHQRAGELAAAAGARRPPGVQGQPGRGPAVGAPRRHREGGRALGPGGQRGCTSPSTTGSSASSPGGTTSWRSTGTTTGTGTATSAASTSSSRPRATARTATSWPSRPTC